MKTRLLKLVVVLSGAVVIASCGANTKSSDRNSETILSPLNYKLLEHENIGRGVIAIPLEMGKKVYSGEGTFDSDKRRVYIGWRLLASDPDNAAFNVYRQTENGRNYKNYFFPYLSINKHG